MKETILIIGDSWAATWWTSIRNVLDVTTPNTKFLTLDNNLQKLGYEVINKSWWGASNCETLSSALQHLRFRSPDLPKIKLIVFFFTELLRDLRFLNTPPELIMEKDLSFDDYLDRCYKRQLSVIEKIRELEPNADWAIIGGHAPVYKVEDWKWASYVKENWREEIVGYPIPACHSLGYQDWVAEHFDFDTRMRELHNCELVENAGKHLFNDGVHPDLNHHHALSQEIINHFNL